MLQSKQLGMLLLGAVLTLSLVACGEQEKGLRITGLEPKAGPHTGGDTVTIYGSGFTSDGAKGVEVWFGKKRGRNIRFRGDTKLVVEAPGGSIGEVVDVIIVFDDARQKPIKDAYTYIDPGQGFTVDELTDKQE